MIIPCLGSGEGNIENKSSRAFAKIGSTPFKNKILALLMVSGLVNAEDVAGKTPRDTRVQTTLEAFGKQLPNNTTLEGFIKGVQDGLSPDEEAKLRESMSKVVTGSPQYKPFAQLVLNALDQNIANIAEDNGLGKPLPAAEKANKTSLTETPEQKKQREASEKMLGDATVFFNDPKNYKPGEDNTVSVELRETGGQLVFTVKKVGAPKKPKDGEVPTGWIRADYGDKRMYHFTPGKTYRLTSKPYEDKKNKKDVDSLPVEQAQGEKLIFFSKNWERLGMDGKPNKTFSLSLTKGEPKELKIPAGTFIVERKFTDLELPPDQDGKPATQKRYGTGLLVIEEVEGPQAPVAQN